MDRIQIKRVKALLVVGIMIIAMLPFAEAATSDREMKYYMGSAVNAGKDTGYSETNSIKESDPHFGWELGTFYVSGFTNTTKDESGNPVILKTTGDKVTLWFSLEQNIDVLNGDGALSIADDTKGFDEYFGIDKTNFGRGTLIIRHTDYQNKTQKPIIYTDYLAALVAGTDIQVEVF